VGSRWRAAASAFSSDWTASNSVTSVTPTTLNMACRYLGLSRVTCLTLRAQALPLSMPRYRRITDLDPPQRIGGLVCRLAPRPRLDHLGYRDVGDVRAAVAHIFQFGPLFGSEGKGCE